MRCHSHARKRNPYSRQPDDSRSRVLRVVHNLLQITSNSRYRRNVMDSVAGGVSAYLGSGGGAVDCSHAGLGLFEAPVSKNRTTQWRRPQRKKNPLEPPVSYMRVVEANNNQPAC